MNYKLSDIKVSGLRSLSAVAAFRLIDTALLALSIFVRVLFFYFLFSENFSSFFLLFAFALLHWHLS